MLALLLLVTYSTRRIRSSSSISSALISDTLFTAAQLIVTLGRTRYMPKQLIALRSSFIFANYLLVSALLYFRTVGVFFDFKIAEGLKAAAAVEEVLKVERRPLSILILYERNDKGAAISQTLFSLPSSLPLLITELVASSSLSSSSSSSSSGASSFIATSAVTSRVAFPILPALLLVAKLLPNIYSNQSRLVGSQRQNSQ